MDRKNQLRMLMKQEKAKKAISPFLQVQDGNYFCKLCKIAVKNENYFLIHEKSAQHTMMIKKLKQAQMLKRKNVDSTPVDQESLGVKNNPSSVNSVTSKQTNVTKKDCDNILDTISSPPSDNQKTSLNTKDNIQEHNIIADKISQNVDLEEESVNSITESGTTTTGQLSQRELFLLLEKEEEESFQKTSNINTNEISNTLPEGFFDEAPLQVEPKPDKMNDESIDDAFKQFKSEIEQEELIESTYDTNEMEDKEEIARQVQLEKEEQKKHLEHLQSLTTEMSKQNMVIPDIKLKRKQVQPISDDEDEDVEDLFSWRKKGI